MKRLIYLALLACIVACEESQTRSCLKGPCGSIVDSKFNYALRYDPNLNVNSISWSNSSTSEELAVELAEESYFSCWNQTNIFPDNTTNLTVNFLSGESISLDIDGESLESNAVIFEIESDLILYYDWDFTCDDTPNL